MQNVVQNKTLETCFLQHCNQGKTGTILIATQNNKSCQISISNGEVIGATMGKYKGYAAAQALAKVDIRGASFNKNMQFPHSHEAMVISSNKFLTTLDYNR